MQNKIKKGIIVLGVGGTIVMGLVFGAFSNQIPPELQLKVTVDKIVYSAIDENATTTVNYKYISTNIVEGNYYFVDDNQEFSSGLIYQNGNQTSIVFNLNNVVYRNIKNKKLYQIKDATTTLDAWNEQTPITLTEIIWGRSVYADTETFTSDTNWQAPAGVSSVQVELWAGGGGGGAPSGNNFGSGGGAGGQYVIDASVSVTAGDWYWLDVAGGCTANGCTGNDSTFATTTVVAKGGAGASGSDDTVGGVGSSLGGVGDTVYAGGSGADGGERVDSGGGGGGAGSTGVGGNASGLTGGTGTSADGGNGGDGTPSGTTADGESGYVYGGGGGGCFKKTGGCVGGDGAAGQIKLTYTVGGGTPITPDYNRVLFVP